MSRARILVYSLIAAAFIFTTACSRSDSKVELQGRYDAMNSAIKAKDVDKFMGFLATDFEQVGVDKTVLKRTKMDEITRAVTKEAVDIDSKTTVETVTVSGDRADVTATSVQKITMKEPTGDKTHVVEITSTSQDVWKKDNGEWKMLQSTETKHAVTRDGQVVAAPSAAPKK